MTFTKILLLFSIISICSCNNRQATQQESSSTPSKDQKAETPVAQKDTSTASHAEVKVFSNDTVKNSGLSGFGYDIYVNNRLAIHQPNIPAVNGNMGFKTKEDAQKAGELAAYKISNNIMPPAVSVQELDSLGIRH